MNFINTINDSLDRIENNLFNKHFSTIFRRQVQKIHETLALVLGIDINGVVDNDKYNDFNFYIFDAYTRGNNNIKEQISLALNRLQTGDYGNSLSFGKVGGINGDYFTVKSLNNIYNLETFDYRKQTRSLTEQKKTLIDNINNTLTLEKRGAGIITKKKVNKKTKQKRHKTKLKKTRTHKGGNDQEELQKLIKRLHRQHSELFYYKNRLHNNRLTRDQLLNNPTYYINMYGSEQLYTQILNNNITGITYTTNQINTINTAIRNLENQIAIIRQRIYLGDVEFE